MKRKKEVRKKKKEVAEGNKSSIIKEWMKGTKMTKLLKTSSGRMLIHTLVLFKTGHVGYFGKALLRYVMGKG
jgi:hypothetical protein